MSILFRFSRLALAAALMLTSVLAQAQNTIANPNAENDMKLVGDFVNAIISGDQAKARSLASPTFMAHGPAAADSANIDKTLKIWEETYKTQSNRKANFVSQSFRVPSGNYKGDWVSQWGDYSFTDVATGKTITFPYQYTAMVANGKVLSDRIYYDVLSILTQVGFKVIPPGVAKK